jgi:acyl-CoA synthetase (AMP-forming)/AMP-acid ligase II
MNISGILELAVALAPERRIATDAERTLTIADLDACARRAAGAIEATAAHAGPVAFLGINSAAVPVGLFAAALSGRALSPLNFRADRRLLTHFVEDLEPSLVICDDQYRASLEEAVDGRVPILATPALWAGAEPVYAPAGSDDPAVILFTSGTTSLPKRVILRHRHLTSYVLNTVAPASEALSAATLIAAPPYHVAGVANLLTSVYSGRRMVYLPGFDAENWLRVAREQAVTSAFVVPTMLHRIVERLREGDAAPEHLRTLSYGGAPASRTLVEDALRLFAPETGFVNAYGLTETSSTIALLGPDDHRAAISSTDPAVRARLASAGRPVPGIEVRIEGHEEGEILLRGPQVSGEYGQTGATLDDDGWFHTGDVGRLDAGGYLHIAGRLDDMIIRGGENISPLEVEDALLAHPAVSEAAVVGVPDVEWGQCVEAVVVLEATVGESDLTAYARERLPGFKVPRRIHVVDELPRTDLGKLQRSKVRRLVAEPVR